jgi:ASC-1-like (ASCH) protein
MVAMGRAIFANPYICGVTDMHECNVSSPWFEHIATGAKTVEGRLHKGVFALLRPNSRLLIKGPGGQQMRVTVARVTRYKSFRSYLEAEGLRATLPGIETVSAGVRIYRKFYSREQEDALGVVAVELLTKPANSARCAK